VDTGHVEHDLPGPADRLDELLQLRLPLAQIHRADEQLGRRHAQEVPPLRRHPARQLVHHGGLPDAGGPEEQSGPGRLGREDLPEPGDHPLDAVGAGQPALGLRRRQVDAEPGEPVRIDPLPGALLDPRDQSGPAVGSAQLVQVRQGLLEHGDPGRLEGRHVLLELRVEHLLRELRAGPGHVPVVVLGQARQIDGEKGRGDGLAERLRRRAPHVPVPLLLETAHEAVVEAPPALRGPDREEPDVLRVVVEEPEPPGVGAPGGVVEERLRERVPDALMGVLERALERLEELGFVATRRGPHRHPAHGALVGLQQLEDRRDVALEGLQQGRGRAGLLLEDGRDEGLELVPHQNRMSSPR
jgi:hypothetical protein